MTPAIDIFFPIHKTMQNSDFFSNFDFLEISISFIYCLLIKNQTRKFGEIYCIVLYNNRCKKLRWFIPVTKVRSWIVYIGEKLKKCRGSWRKLSKTTYDRNSDSFPAWLLCHVAFGVSETWCWLYCGYSCPIYEKY